MWTREESVTSAVLGYSLEVADWNGDGTRDVLAAAPFAAFGKVWGYSGRDGSTLAILTGGAGSISFGASVATGGDLDGNGVDDVLVAATNATAPPGANTGVVSAFALGAPGGGQFAPPEGHAFVLSLPRAPSNHVLPAKLPSDPRLTDSGGDPGTGPLIGSASEPFNLSLDCTGSSPGPYLVVVHADASPVPMPTGFGHLWVSGRRLFRHSGAHTGNVV